MSETLQQGKKKKIKGIKIRMEEINPSLFANGEGVNRKSQGFYIPTTGTNKFSRITSYKNNTQNPFYMHL